jgi:glycosyltransferase involved in cell wall biosynthesis
MNQRSTEMIEHLARPKVSVIIPVYNGERFLDEAIYSIRNQTEPNIEILLIDDGSTDRSLEMLRHHAAEDDRVRVIEREHLGVSNALNSGIEAARSDWIARLDQDDVSAPDRLAKQLDLLASFPEAGMVGSFCWIIGETGRTVGLHKIGPTTLEEFWALDRADLMRIVSSSVVFSRALALRLGGYRAEYEPAEDYDLSSRIADGHVVLAVPEPLVEYRIHGASVTTRRLALQMRSARRIIHNTIQRRAGQAELAWEEFTRYEQGQPVLHRALRNVQIKSLSYYRKGAGLLAAGNASGLAFLGLSVIVYPPLPIRRIWSQGVIPQALNNARNRSRRQPPG